MFFFICELHLFNLFYCFQFNKSQIITKFGSCQYESHETRNSVYILNILEHAYKTRKYHIGHRNNTFGPEGMIVARKTNVLVRIPNVISSLLTIYL